MTGITIAPKPVPEGSGGRVAVYDPWRLDPASLRAVAFEYLVPTP